MFEKSQRLPRIESVTVPILQTNANRIMFPKVPTLDRSQIVALRLFSVTQLPVSPNGATTPADAVMARGFVTLVGQDNSEIHRDIPLTEFIRNTYAGWFYQFSPCKVNWEKSFIRFVGATLVLNTELTFNVGYFYDADQPGMPIGVSSTNTDRM